MSYIIRESEEKRLKRLEYLCSKTNMPLFVIAKEVGMKREKVSKLCKENGYRKIKHGREPF